jgi:hypothetical protein
MSYPQVPRLVVLFATPAGLDGAVLETALRRTRDALAGRLGSGAVVRAAVRIPDDPLVAMMGERDAVSTVEGVLEASLAEGADPERLVAGAAGLAAELRDIAEPGSVCVLAGIAYLVWADDGALLLALGGTRDPSISVENMRAWWLEQHAELVKEVVRPRSPGYDQLHVDRDLSARASDAAGVPYVAFDLFDSIDVNSVEELTRSTLMEPETAQRLFADELGHVDHSSLRGALCRVLDA